MEITVKTDTEILHIPFSEQSLLDDILIKAGLKITRPCGGRGVCGKCKVKASGALSPISSDEKRLLSKEEIEEGFRLACRTTVSGNASITLNIKKDPIRGITGGYLPEFEKKPLTGEKNCFCAAIDIGTTTIAAYFYKMPECICVKQICAENPQSQFGADVISRIQYANEGGLNALQKAVQNKIDEMKKDFAKPVEETVITGNTTMLHLLTGLDPSGIAAAPFTPKSLFGQWQNSVYLAPCISAYVGADITTAILASEMQKDSSSLLIDIGTNGEMAYWDGQKLTCCSTAAGPAFEGAGIYNGMAALPGAIDHVWAENGKLCYSTIDNIKPSGICGSGLIDAVFSMLKLKIIDETGYMEEDCDIGGSGIIITPEDIRRVQLAKAAIRAGIEILVPEAGKAECVYIAGGFGSYVDIDSCIGIGLLPPAFRDKIKILGNAAGNGAAMILQSSDCLKKAEEIAKNAETTELSYHPEFMEQYMEQMMFTE